MMQKKISPNIQFSIRITDSSLSFACRKDGSREIEYEPYDMKISMSPAANLRDAFKNCPILDEAGDRVIVSLGSPLLLIPIDDYDKTQINDQYKYVYPDTEGVLLRSTVLPSPKTIAVFSMSKDLNVVLSDHFEEVVVEPVMARMWDFLLRRDEAVNNRKVYVYFREDKVEISSFSRRRFAFANTFKAKTAGDALYFILGAWKQTGANAEKDILVVCGKTPERDAIMKELQQYIRRVHFLDPCKEFDNAPCTRNEDMPLDLMMQYI